jgi:hypothetical protein
LTAPDQIVPSGSDHKQLPAWHDLAHGGTGVHSITRAVSQRPPRPPSASPSGGVPSACSVLDDASCSPRYLNKTFCSYGEAPSVLSLRDHQSEQRPKESRNNRNHPIGPNPGNQNHRGILIARVGILLKPMSLTPLYHDDIMPPYRPSYRGIDIPMPRPREAAPSG